MKKLPWQRSLVFAGLTINALQFRFDYVMFRPDLLLNFFVFFLWSVWIKGLLSILINCVLMSGLLFIIFGLILLNVWYGFELLVTRVGRIRCEFF